MPENAVPKKRGNLKFKLACLGFFLMMGLGCLAVLIFLWFAGYIKQFTCNTVLPDSAIFQRLNCATQTVTTNAESNFPTTQLNPGTSGSANEDSLITKIVEQTSPAVIAIGVTDSQSNQNQTIGSGFLVSTAGLIVTNRHVVEDDTLSYYASFKGQDKVVNIAKTDIIRDPVNDIALIKIDPAKLPANITPLPLGDSDKLKIGQEVIAIGNPLGEFNGSVTKGIISGLNRQVNVDSGSFFSTTTQAYDDVIQTDAAINPGNSGGPLIDSLGQVIGVNFATVSGAANLSFALPINRVKQRIEELDKFGKFQIPFMGVEYRTRVIFVGNISTAGAQILTVSPGSPAEKAGIQVGDVIVQFNGSDLAGKSLSSLIQATKIGDKVKVNLIRAQQPLELEVTIGQK